MTANQKSLAMKRDELTTRVALFSSKAIEIGGQVLTPDRTRAYVEFYLSHAFPVVVSDKAAIHPRVVANSYASMLHQVFDLAHLIVQYNPEENPRDRILGSIVGVELTDRRGGDTAPYLVGTSKLNALGIRAVAVMHRQAEGVEAILESYKDARLKWTVSMEVDYWLENSGFAVKRSEGSPESLRGSGQRSELDKWEAGTPEDIKRLGYVYVPWTEAPEELKACASENEPTQEFRGQETVLLQGGLDGYVHYKGVGLTPLGKEAEARVKQMMAGGTPFVESDGELVWDVAGPLRKTLELIGKVK